MSNQERRNQSTSGVGELTCGGNNNLVGNALLHKEKTELERNQRGIKGLKPRWKDRTTASHTLESYQSFKDHLPDTPSQ
ncbi:hypothetical protein E2C01_040941 [Portunus trituberculatus]|uniref:Uncharacterized protein n=1 Tax=Portunus trituberculatus TaxID=210409 RepID=A0A5B7FNY5_PORTR|nr:hypothetical protein [Portunus trituberculatus]